MARVVFFLWPEPGHALPALGLAKALARRSHEVTFVSWGATLDLARINGFSALDVFELTGLVEARARWNETGGWSEKLLEQERARVVGAVEALVPALVIIDPLFWRLTLLFAQHSVSCVHLSANLPDEFDPEIFPWSSTRPPGGGSIRAKLARHVAWGGVRLSGWLKHRLRWSVASDTLDLTDARRLLRESNWPSEWCEPRAFHKPALGVPELVMCPPAFEFPEKRQRAYRYYVESGVDLQRPEDTAGISEILADPRPLVLVSLGSQAASYADSVGVFRMVADVARSAPDTLFVVAVVESDVSGVAFPDNVKVRKTIPQLALLRHASAMVTHGGLGTVKECIVSGVPMCVVPLKWDQPSVAARVEYHGLGIALNARGLTSSVLSRALQQVLSNTQFKLRAELMRVAFEQVAEAEPGARLIDALLSSHRESRVSVTTPARLEHALVSG